MTADPLEDRIQHACRLSTQAGGAMPVVIIVADEAEKARGLKLLKGRKGSGAVSVKVRS